MHRSRIDSFKERFLPKKEKMSKAVVVGTSAPTTSRKRKAPTAASSIVNSLAPTPSRSHLAASRPKNASASTKPTTGARASSAGPSTAQKRPKAAALVSGGHAGVSSAGTSTTQTKARKASLAAAAAGPASRPPSKTAKIPKEKPEKRLARYIASPSTATSERIERAFQHRLYLIDKKLSGDDPRAPSSCDFNVLGSTGNVYKVKLQQRPVCTCPDFPRSGLCKHILFVMLRVLKLDRYDPRVWQKALLTSELKELLEISATSDGVLASQSVRQRFQEIQKSSGRLDEGANGEVDAAPKTIQREITGDCPICYEGMDDGNRKPKEPVVFCRVCGNNVHRDCFEKWTRSKISSGGQTTCIYCRALWVDGVETTKKGTIASAYVNLADVSEPHRSQHLSLEDLYPESHQWIRHGGRRGRRRYSD